MNLPSDTLAPERSPAIQGLLAQAQARVPMGLAGSERTAEGVVGGAFVLAAVLVAVAMPTSRGLQWDEAAVVILLMALASRVVFEVGSCYTMPTQLAIVPALFLLPPELVPLFACAGLMLGRLTEVAQGRLAPARTLMALGDSWFAIGPAVVLAAAGAPGPTEASVAVLVGALGAQFGADTVASRVREMLHHDGISLRDQLHESAWVYGVDTLLAPVGLAVAIAAEGRPLAVLLVAPLLVLMLFFARERDERLRSLLELSDAYRGTAHVLGDVVGHDDAYTGEHTAGVVELASRVAADLGLDARRQRAVEFGALLHDVGKIAIPKEIIRKPGPLDDGEWSVIKTHTVEGQRMLDKIGGLMQEVGRVVRSAHERWDGDGYPDGLRGEEIPLESRIIFCCDAYSAITTDRPYRRARSQEAAIDELRANAGTQFDPKVVEVFVARLEADAGPTR